MIYNTFLFCLDSPVMIQTPPPSPIQISSKVPQPGPYSVSVEHLASMSREATAATVLPERAWQECVTGGAQSSVVQTAPVPPTAASTPGGGVTTTNPPHTGGNPTPTEFTGNWDFVDPSRRATCTCSK